MRSRGKIAVAVMAMAIGVTVAGFWFSSQIAEIKLGVRDGYAKWAVADMVVAFYERHHKLPATWDDLKSVFSLGSPFDRGGLSFAEVQDLIIVDFDRLHEFRMLGDRIPSPAVIRARDGRSMSWSGMEPNEVIFQYFHPRSASDAVSPSSQP